MPSGFFCAAWGREAGAGEGRGSRGFRVESAGSEVRRCKDEQREMKPICGRCAAGRFARRVRRVRTGTAAITCRCRRWRAGWALAWRANKFGSPRMWTQRIERT